MEVFKDARAAAAFSPDKMKKVNLFDSARMFCDVYGLQPGQEQTAHAHAGSDKVYFVLDGVGHFRIGEEEREVGTGYAVLRARRRRATPSATPARRALTVLVFMAPKPA